MKFSAFNMDVLPTIMFFGIGFCFLAHSLMLWYSVYVTPPTTKVMPALWLPFLLDSCANDTDLVPEKQENENKSISKHKPHATPHHTFLKKTPFPFKLTNFRIKIQQRRSGRICFPQHHIAHHLCDFGIRCCFWYPFFRFCQNGPHCFG